MLQKCDQGLLSSLILSWNHTRIAQYGTTAEFEGHQVIVSIAAHCAPIIIYITPGCQIVMPDDKVDHRVKVNVT